MGQQLESKEIKLETPHNPASSPNEPKPSAVAYTNLKSMDLTIVTLERELMYMGKIHMIS